MLIKRKTQFVTLLCLFFVAALIVFFKWKPAELKTFTVEYEIWDDHCDTFQVFYSDGYTWNETAAVARDYYSMGEFEKFSFEIPGGMYSIRLDLGNIPGCVRLKNVNLISKGDKFPLWDIKMSEEASNIGEYQTTDGVLTVQAGNDTYMVYDIHEAFQAWRDKEETRALWQKAAIIAVLFVLFLLIYKYCASAMAIAKSICKNAKLIKRLAVTDFKAKYAGNQFGIVWAFVPPTVTALIYIFVFQIIGRAAPYENSYPYSLWLLPGMIPWFYFSESITSSTNCLVEYSYLVKKIMFNVEILPVVKIVSAFFVHVFLTAFVVLVYLIARCPIKLEMLQIPYYMFCTTALALAFGYLTCSLLPFFKDMGQIINLVMMVGMWACPIMWDMNILSEDQVVLKTVLKLNPMYYVVNGYRSTFMGTSWITDDLLSALYFWSVVLCLFVLNTKVFKKVQPHFSDVL